MHTFAKFVFPGLFFYVNIESPNPKKTSWPHNMEPKPYQLKTQTPKCQSLTTTPKPLPPKLPLMRKIEKVKRITLGKNIVQCSGVFLLNYTGDACLMAL